MHGKSAQVIDTIEFGEVRERSKRAVLKLTNQLSAYVESVSYSGIRGVKVAFPCILGR